MKLREYTDKEAMRSAIREEAIDTISCIINDWEGWTNKQKIASIVGVLTFLAGLDADLAEEKKNAAT